jgi:anti-sigma B factor antagonist
MAEHRVAIRGDVDLATVAQLRADLKRTIVCDGTDVVVDCTDMTFIDSAGIVALLEAHRMLEAAGRQLQIVNVAPSLRGVFTILGLDDLLRHDRAAH